MGGALALHTAYRWDQNMAGVFAFGSFLNKESIVYRELKNISKVLGKLHYLLFIDFISITLY